MKTLWDFYQQLMKPNKEKSVSSTGKGQSALECENIYYEIEDLLCFERAIRFCYASLELMIHNQAIRRQCQNFYQRSLIHEEELENILTEVVNTNIKIQKGYETYSLPAEDLNIESILSLGLAVTEHRLNIYQELRNCLPMKSRILLTSLIAHVGEEIKFFQREKEMVTVESILYSLG